jgi:cyclophilin family peptidyl-prolyl cis-trans isomerase
MVASDLDSITIDGTNVGLCIVVMFQESIQFFGRICCNVPGKHTIFGRICGGMEVVKRLGSVQTDKNDR